MLAKQLRLAFCSLNACFSTVTAPNTYAPLICNHVTPFKITPSERQRSRLAFRIHRMDTNQLLFKVFRTRDGLRLLNATNRPLYYVTRSACKKAVHIKRCNSDDVLFTLQQRGRLFCILDVYHGDACDAMPFMQVCGACDYELSENESGRRLALVRRVVRWHQTACCEVQMATGLDAALYLLLVATINDSCLE
eukprot:TRINITY_DN35262_c0_g1_i1.p1 TRINITY_DN35262_c0_g1~~TRINITY_DN35262_c0_g1_i1.p1  ORF type:complete len:193 (+),score=31.93 TRINITY_DN35262_c0_g1_i1:286-864(+)